MVIVDRNLDLIPMISHSWTYQSLVSEVLSMKLNRIVIETTVDGKTTRKGYDIDSEDFFWRKNAPHPFPQVAEGIVSAPNLTDCRYRRRTIQIQTRRNATNTANWCIFYRGSRKSVHSH